jgi:ABC-type lipoprotein export system ATPase subunit
MLAVADLRKSFESPEGGRAEVVDVRAFGLAEGEQIALRGESGSGKTTFLNLIAGILAPDSGRVEIDGADMAALSEARRDRLRATKLGYIFQTFNLLQGYTVLENVALGMSRAARARRLEPPPRSFSTAAFHGPAAARGRGSCAGQSAAAGARGRADRKS